MAEIARGYNPLRWDCEKSGCFNKERRPKLEVFADCFPGKIGFGDVDGQVELNGRFCQLEWKGPGGSVRVGQHLAYARFSRLTLGNVVLIVHGDAKAMIVSGYQSYSRGRRRGFQPATLEDVKTFFRLWVDWVSGMKGDGH